MPAESTYGSLVDAVEGGPEETLTLDPEDVVAGVLTLEVLEAAELGAGVVLAATTVDPGCTTVGVCVAGAPAIGYAATTVEAGAELELALTVCSGARTTFAMIAVGAAPRPP